MPWMVMRKRVRRRSCHKHVPHGFAYTQRANSSAREAVHARAQIGLVWRRQRRIAMFAPLYFRKIIDKSVYVVNLEESRRFLFLFRDEKKRVGMPAYIVVVFHHVPITVEKAEQ